MLKKAKKIFRILFPKKISVEKQFEERLKNNVLISDFKRSTDQYLVTLSNGLNLYIRNYNFSDYKVFQQIFEQKEYDIVLKMVLTNDFRTKETIIIDAGANVGYTSVFFAKHLSNYKIFAVEPSIENYSMYLKNSQWFENLKIYHHALSEKSNAFFTINREFRDGKDWSISTKEDSTGTIKGISVQEIIEENNLDYITVLKIDIEGAERFIFKKDNNLDFLKKTYIIALEIHDEFNSRTSINRVLLDHNFFIFESGELTICVNKALI